MLKASKKTCFSIVVVVFVVVHYCSVGMTTTMMMMMMPTTVSSTKLKTRYSSFTNSYLVIKLTVCLPSKDI